MCRPIACSQNIAHEKSLFVAHRVGDAVQPLIGIGNTHVFGLPTVDAATQRPTAIGIGAIVYIALTAKEAFAAEGFYVDRHPVARLHRLYGGAYLLDDAYHLVPHGNTGHSARHTAMLNMQIAGADASQGNAHQCIARINQLRNRFFG